MLASLDQRSDARSKATTYAYVDSLSRLTGKTYSDSTATVAYAYDGNSITGCTLPSLSNANPYGHRTAMCDGSGATAWGYNEVGDILEIARKIGTTTKDVTDTYNLDSTVKTVAYPNAITVTYAPGGAQRPFSAEDGTFTYAQMAEYWAPGELRSLTNGSSNEILSTLDYNARLEPCRFAINATGTAPSNCGDATNHGDVMDLKYSFNLYDANSICSTSYANGTNNGDAAVITNKLTNGRTQTFCYDALNRIKSGQTTANYSTGPKLCWGETYTIDALANLTGITPMTGAYSGCTQESGMSLSVDTGHHNQLSTGTTPNFTYDASGNMTNDTSYSYTYDAEGHTATGAGVTYTYDGDGNRVEKSSGTLYWYDPAGNIIEETNSSGSTNSQYVFFQGRRIARRDSSGNVYYYFDDQLGTAHYIVQAGSTTACYDAEFYPYGGERITLDGSNNPIDSCDSHYKFTGKERDSESGLDNFGARYDSSQYGRFMSPDPLFATVDRLIDPQQWNMYAYARNNPLSITDPTGLDFNLTCDQDNGTTCVGGLQGRTTTDANGKNTFTATDVDMNDPNNTSAGYHDQWNNQYTGTFDQDNGVSFTNTATGDTSSNSRFIDGSDETDVNGSGSLFGGTQGRFNSNCGGSCEAKGSLYDLPGHAGAVANAEKIIGASFGDNFNFIGGYGPSGLPRLLSCG